MNVRRFLPVAAALFTILSSSFMHGQSPALVPGQSAPDFSLKDLGGHTVTLGSLLAQRQIVILHFWGTWCGPCLPELPDLQRFFKEQSAHGASLVTVDLGEKAGPVKDLMKRRGYVFPVLLDPDQAMAKQYFATVVPRNVIIRPDGSVKAVFRDSGRYDSVYEALVAAVK